MGFKIFLNEAEDFNFDDDLDLQDLGLDTIDDSSEVAKADEITLLRKKAADLAEKWKDTFAQINILARKLDLVAVHDEDLNIELKKLNGSVSKYENDADFLDKVDNIEKRAEDIEEEDVDDSFGPSEYDDRAKELKDEDLPKEIKAQSVSNESLAKADPNELQIREDEIDDEF